ncbi:hypothetical protein D3C85_1383880 [compost metagenome]
MLACGLPGAALRGIGREQRETVRVDEQRRFGDGDQQGLVGGVCRRGVVADQRHGHVFPEMVERQRGCGGEHVRAQRRALLERHDQVVDIVHRFQLSRRALAVQHTVDELQSG